MNTKKFAGAAAIGAVTAVTAMLIGNTVAVADEDGAVNSAYGISAAGLIPIEPTPEVVSEDGEFVEDNIASLASIPGTAELGLTGELLHVEAEDAHSETSVVKFALRDILRADLIRTFCIDGDGGLEIARGELMGQVLATPTIAGEVIDASPLVRVSLGEQVRNEDGSVTVTGIKLTLIPEADLPDTPLTAEDQAAIPALGELLGTAPLPTDVPTVGDLVDEIGLPVGADGALQTIIIGSATCTEAGDGDDGDDGKDKDYEDGDEHDSDGVDDEATDEAPTPDVVEADLPVTG